MSVDVCSGLSEVLQRTRGFEIEVIEFEIGGVFGLHFFNEIVQEREKVFAGGLEIMVHYYSG